MNKQHYHMASGKLTFTDPDKDGAIGTIQLNAVIVTADGNITLPQIDKAHRTLIKAMREKIDAEEKMKVHDVFLYPFTYLGRMTQAQFGGQETEVANDAEQA